MNTLKTDAISLPELLTQEDVTAVVAEVARRKREANKIKDKYKADISEASHFHKALIAERDAAIEPYEQAVALGERLLSEFATRMERLNTLVRAQAGADIRRARLEDPDIVDYIADIRETDGDVAADMFAAEVRHMELPATLPVHEEQINYGPGQTRREYTIEYVDIESIPREYWKLDESKIKKVISAGVAIPGVASSVSLKRIVKAEGKE